MIATCQIHSLTMFPQYASCFSQNVLQISIAYMSGMFYQDLWVLILVVFPFSIADKTVTLEDL